MPQLHLTATFLNEPFRLLEWTDPSKRRRSHTPWHRDQGFARWHKFDTDKGLPFITGTNVRSRVITEVEGLLARHQGQWEGIPCCTGVFHTPGAPLRHWRYRPTLTWPGADKKTCTSREDACLFCLLLGRFDAAVRHTDTYTGQPEDYHVHWSNLKTFHAACQLTSLARPRVLNRVDGFTKKAHDFFRVWEVTGVKVLRGRVTLGEDLDAGRQKALMSLLQAALAFIPSLCGAPCHLILTGPHQASAGTAPASPPAPAPSALPTCATTETLANTLAPSIAQAFADRLPLLRTLADAIRNLRRYDPVTLELPRGHLPESDLAAASGSGTPTDHYVWDIRIPRPQGALPLRRVLKQAADTIDRQFAATNAVAWQWRRFCEALGQKLYEAVKTSDPRLERQRPLGEAEFRQMPRQTPQAEPLRVTGAPTCEWIICGHLQALTPFHLGDDIQPGHQNSMPVLLDADGHYRLPRSALRGALRRDLNLASGGMGCAVALGPEQPCSCPVCQVLRQVQISETCSALNEAPEVRQKISRNPVLGIVNEGSLFDMELGLQGERFPFWLRYRGHAVLPESLKQVLAWWQEGRLVIGGASGTGRGRFALKQVHAYRWHLLDGQAAYIEHHGARGIEAELLQRHTTLNGLEAVAVIAPSKEAAFPFAQVTWALAFNGPLLCGDPLTALLESSSDMLAYRKPVWTGQQTVDRWAIPADTVRGLVRTACGRQIGRLTELHEDCDCLLCEGFGSRYHEGKLRFEDLEPGSAPVSTLRLDHVAINRIDGGARDQAKYDDTPLVGTQQQPLVFTGCFWIRQDASPALQDTLIAALRDLRAGMYPLGANGSIGYGWISALTLIDGPAWLLKGLQDPSAPASVTDATAAAGSTGSTSSTDTNEVTDPVDTTDPIDANDPTDSTDDAIDATDPTDPTDAKDIADASASESSEAVPAPPALPDLTLNPAARYWPHYFVPLGKAARRVREPIGHDTLNPEVDLDSQTGLPPVATDYRTTIRQPTLSGRLCCTLTTQTPLIVPDTSIPTSADGPAGAPAGHKSYRFFRLGDRVMLPGSELRGMISSVFEALTGSCLRVMNTKQHLSWRISAGDAKHYQPGVIRKKGERWVVEPHKSFRLPFYAGADPRQKLDKEVLEGKKTVKLWVKEKQPANNPKAVCFQKSDIPGWKKFSKAADDKIPGWEKMSKATVDLRQKTVTFTWNKMTFTLRLIDVPKAEPNVNLLEIPCWVKINPVYMASLFQPDRSWELEQGLVVVTGPNKVEVDTGSPPDPILPRVPAHWEDVHITTDGSVPPKGDRFFRCQQDGATYTVAKWCEAFWVRNENAAPLMLDESAIKGYHLIMASYQDNPQAPPDVFRSRPVRNYQPDQENLNGLKVFYLKQNRGSNQVTEIVPVKISRTADISPMGEKLSSPTFLPCAKVCLDDCAVCTAKNCRFLPLYREGYPADGLCPACHLFGCTGYKGRVRFGFAHLDSTPQFCHAGQTPAQRAVTLPLLERPRLTWVMPKKGVSVPGRKFYVHHQGWKSVVERQQHPVSGEAITPTANNRTVEPLAAGNPFQFEVFFDNLTPAELGLLCYCLELEPGLAHKLGMGKAFGFGSVTIQIDRIEQRLPKDWVPASDDMKRQWIVDGHQWLLNNIASMDTVHWYDTDTVRHLRKVLQYVADENVRVHYPKLKKTTAQDPCPGYMELKNSGFDAREVLTRPWQHWWADTP